MTKVFAAIGAFLTMICLFFVLNLTGVICNEYSPDRMLKKYEWFKDQSTQLQQLQSRIKSTEKRLADFKVTYGADVNKWGWETKDEYNRVQTVLQGYLEQYNYMAAEYNSQSSKFNWKSFEGKIPETYQEYK